MLCKLQIRTRGISVYVLESTSCHQ